MGKNRDARQFWKTLFQQFEPLRAKVRIDSRRAGDVSTRVGKTGDNPCLDEIIRIGSDDRDCARHFLSGNDRGHTGRHNDIHAKADQLGDEFRHALDLPVRASILDYDVLAFYVAEIS